MASVRKIIEFAEIYTKKVLLINLNNFVLRCENAVKACAEIDPKIDEGKWYEIKKEPTKPSNQVPYIYQYQAGIRFHQKPYPNILIMVTYTITLWRVLPVLTP